MNKLSVLLLLVVLAACERKPFVEHKLDFKKVTDDCSKLQSYFHMNSNFGGERYEFEKCLPADFQKDQLSSERRGDTVVISFHPLSPGQKTAVYQLTLDIDSYPPYKFLTIDEDTYTIVPSQK
jgi:hypothetical protein